MAVFNEIQTTTLQVTEDLNAAQQYHAIDFSDGKIADTGLQACGILMNKPKNGEFGTLAHFGECKFHAGGAITAGARITVATSGYFTACASGYYVVGTCKTTVTSGSIGVGIFNFATRYFMAHSA